jgi:hypothetical protein
MNALMVHISGRLVAHLQKWQKENIKNLIYIFFDKTKINKN